MKFKLKLANVIVEVDSRYDYLQEYCKDYCVLDGEPEVSIALSDEEIEKEQSQDDKKYSLGYLETVAMLRRVSEEFSTKKRMLFHGAAIQDAFGDVYLFAGRSGVGKSTHIGLWKRYVNENIEVLNGDKPMIAVEEDVRVYGTPWAGKEGWQKNSVGVLKGICFIEQGKENKIRKLSVGECLGLIFKQVYIPVHRTGAAEVLTMIHSLVKKMPIYLLTCDISRDAVKCSYEAMTGRTLEEE